MMDIPLCLRALAKDLHSVGITLQRSCCGSKLNIFSSSSLVIARILWAGNRSTWQDLSISISAPVASASILPAWMPQQLQ